MDIINFVNVDNLIFLWLDNKNLNHSFNFNFGYIHNRKHCISIKTVNINKLECKELLDYLSTSDSIKCYNRHGVKIYYKERNMKILLNKLRGENG